MKIGHFLRFTAFTNILYVKIVALSALKCYKYDCIQYLYSRVEKSHI